MPDNKLDQSSIEDIISKALEGVFNNKPQGTATAPQGTATAPQGTATAPQGTATAPQGTATAPQGTATAPQGTATAPQGTATAPQGTATAPQGTATAPQGVAAGASGGTVIGSGTEGSLVLQDDGRLLKIYNSGYKCNAKVLAKVKAMKGKGYVVDLHDYGHMDYQGRSCDFELMENCPLGAASKYKLKGNKEAILAIAVKTALCIDACHRAGFIHKDIKPANILIKNDKKWDCVLCDFGIADVLSQGKVTTIQSRTPIYAAPEVYDASNTIVLDGRTLCQLTPKADFYSLGMVILCLWYGEQAFLAKETEMAMQKIKGAIKVPADMPDPLNTIVRGLLVKDPVNRWGLDEIQRTLKGEKVPVVEGGLGIVYDGTHGRVANTLEELAACMVWNRDLGVKYLYGGKISKWLEAYPEIQIKIDQFVEKEFKSYQMMGLLATIHTLNPLYDINLCCDPKSPSYAMTGESIGRVLNDVYNIWYSKYECDRSRMWKEWDSDDKSKVRGQDIAYSLVKSFDSYNEGTYLAWFLKNKAGGRFANQLSWLKYCLDFNSRDNLKKAGPKDSDYKVQTAMMKTIAGFGHKPSYDDSGALHLGLRGYLAVLYHENPDANLKPKYAYEKLLEQYLAAYRRHVPDCEEGRRFDSACANAASVAKKARSGHSDLRRRSTAQRVLTLLLAAIPALFLIGGIILLIVNYPVVDLGGMRFKGVFSVIGVLVGLVIFFTSDMDNCLGSILLGFLASFIIFLLVKFLGSYITWIYGALALALVIYFLAKTVFAKNKNRSVSRMTGKPGYEELRLEPLYFAFNGESYFNSTLNRFIDVNGRSNLKSELDARRKVMIMFILVTWVLIALQVVLFDKVLKPEVSLKDQMIEQVEHIVKPAGGDSSEASENTEDEIKEDKVKENKKKSSKKRGIVNE